MISRPVTAVLVSLSLTAMVSAQNPVQQYYDTTRPITLKGNFAGMGLLPGAAHGYLFLDTKDASGKAEIWAIEGDSPSQLARAGWGLMGAGPVALGDAITVVVYRPKPDVKVIETVPVNATRTMEAAKAGRLVRGTDVTLADGKKMVFGS
jgi:hypothetical protein